MQTSSKLTKGLLAIALACLAVACLTEQESVRGPLHDWWKARGPVIPHDTFPTDCKLCHLGETWNELTDDFTFDHEAQTGVALEGAHGEAQCLRCHNDRGPVGVFAARGCAACHEDPHAGQLGRECASCHDQLTWRPSGQIERHAHTRFPLVGIHAATSCQRCHQSSIVGKYLPVDTECVTCHLQDFQDAQNPNHALLGLNRDCHLCHMPTDWNQAQVDPNF